MKKKTEFSRYELWFLLSQLEPAAIIGFRNPMLGILTEDMFPLVQEASFSLLDKGLIYTDTNNQIKIQEQLGTLLRALTAPDHTLLVAFRLKSENNEKVRSMNFEENRVVLMEEIADGSYILRAVASKDNLVSLIAEPFSDKVFWAPDTEPLFFSEEDITAIQQLAGASKMNELKVHLEQANGDEQSKRHLLKTLQNPSVRYSLISFMNRNNLQRNYVDGFSILAGEQYIWILEIVDEAQKIVRVSKITMKDLNKKFVSMIPS